MGTWRVQSLIGQPFTSPGYFWGRPSATSPVPYNAGLSSGSNLGPSNPALTSVVKARVEALHAADPANPLSIPVDLVTASGSGLDPHISVAAANYQVHRIARERNLSEADVQALVNSHIEPRQFWIFGEPRVNVLMLNLALDDMTANHIVPSSVHSAGSRAPGRTGIADSGLDCARPLLWFLCGDRRPPGAVHGQGNQGGTPHPLAAHDASRTPAPRMVAGRG